MNLKDLWTPYHYNTTEKNYQFSWGEIDNHWTLPRITVNDLHDSHSTLVLGLGFASVYVNIPKIASLDGFGGGAYGWYFSEDALVLEWRKHTKFLFYPWAWKFYKHWVLVKGWQKMIWVEIPNGIFSQDIASKDKSPYFYKLKNGTVQARVAEFHVDRREWRMRWLMWLPWPRLVRTSIDVTFNDEVGERSGSWKGGTIGCSYDIKPGERPVRTLRRMQLERVFD